MTTQEQDRFRLKAWDDYEAAKKEFLAYVVKFRDWAQTLEYLAHKMRLNISLVSEADARQMPGSEEVIAALKEFETVSARYRDARGTASDFGWRIDPLV